MSKRFKIYSAPRAEDGRYRFTPGAEIHIREFSDLNGMLQYWKEVILPDSSNEFGMRFELSMTEFSGSEWDFIGDPRYADGPLLNGKSFSGDDGTDDACDEMPLRNSVVK